MLLDILGFCFDMLIEIAFDYGIDCVYRAGSREMSAKKGTHALPA
jgi:hypothetical protein